MSRRKTLPPRGKAPASSVYRHVWESSLDTCFLLHCERDAAGRVVEFVFDDMNPRGAAALGLAKEAVVGRRLCEVVPIRRGGALHQRYVRVAESGASLDEECELDLAEIDARWVRQQVIATSDGIAIIARDISARKEEEYGSRRNRVFLQTLVELLPLLICVKSVRPRDFGAVLVWNEAAERITGYSANDIGAHAAGAVVPPDIDSVMGAIDGPMEGGPPPAEVVLPFVKRDGTARELRSIAVPLRDRYGKPEFVLGIAEDITEIAAAQKQLERDANHDALTGLPSRRLFMDRLAHALDRCGRSNGGLSLLFIDLDNFKAVNDGLGHMVGDALLKEVGGRLSRSARAVDTVCRLSGDEFTVVMEDTGPASLGEAGAVARRIIDAMSEPFEVDGHAISVYASVGISVCPADGADADALIRHAEQPCIRPSELGKNRYRVFRRRVCRRSGEPDGFQQLARDHHREHGNARAGERSARADRRKRPPGLAHRRSSPQRRGFVT